MPFENARYTLVRFFASHARAKSVLLLSRMMMNFPEDSDAFVHSISFAFRRFVRYFRRVVFSPSLICFFVSRVMGLIPNAEMPVRLSVLVLWEDSARRRWDLPISFDILEGMTPGRELSESQAFDASCRMMSEALVEVWIARTFVEVFFPLSVKVLSSVEMWNGGILRRPEAMFFLRS